MSIFEATFRTMIFNFIQWVSSRPQYIQVGPNPQKLQTSALFDSRFPFLLKLLNLCEAAIHKAYSLGYWNPIAPCSLGSGTRGNYVPAVAPSPFPLPVIP